MGKRERRNENYRSGNTSGKSNIEFMKKIRDMYPGILLRDEHGRRAATPHEIQRALEER